MFISHNAMTMQLIFKCYNLIIKFRSIFIQQYVTFQQTILFIFSTLFQRQLEGIAKVIELDVHFPQIGRFCSSDQTCKKI